MTKRWLVGMLTAALVMPGALVVSAVPAPAEVAPPKWSVEQSPGPGGLASISCVTTTRCVAAGTHTAPFHAPRSITYSLEGGTWTHIPSAHTRDEDAFTAVSCATAAYCVAVGKLAEGFAPRPLIETFDGSRWSITPNANKGYEGFLSSVSCPRIDFCVAVGNTNAVTLGNRSRPIIEMWNGRRWSLAPAVDLGAFGGTTKLNSVSCTSATFCLAVGSGTHGVALLGPGLALAEKWDGREWSLTQSVVVSLNQEYDGVSCVELTFCVAVGDVEIDTRAQVTLI